MTSERYEYTKTVWEDRRVERPRTYTETTNSDGSVTHTPAVGHVEKEGTPRDAEHMNKIEDGIEYAVDAVNDLVDRVDQVEEDLSAHVADKNNPHQVTFWETMAAAFGNLGWGKPDCVNTFTGSGKVSSPIVVDGKSVAAQKIITRDANEVAFTPSRVIIFIPGTKMPINELMLKGGNNSGISAQSAIVNWLLPPGYMAAIEIGTGYNYYHSGCGTAYGTKTAGEMLDRDHGGAGVTEDGFAVGSYGNADVDTTMRMNEKGKVYPYFAWK